MFILPSTENISPFVISLAGLTVPQYADSQLQKAMIQYCWDIAEAVALYAAAQKNPEKQNDVEVFKAFGELAASFQHLIQWFQEYSKNNLTQEEAETIWATRFKKIPHLLEQADFSACAKSR